MKITLPTPNLNPAFKQGVYTALGGIAVQTAAFLAFNTYAAIDSKIQERKAKAETEKEGTEQETK